MKLLLEMRDELLLFPGDKGGQAVFTGLAGAVQLFLKVVAP